MTKYGLPVKVCRALIHVLKVVVTPGVFFLTFTLNVIKVICHPRNSIYFLQSIKMGLSYKHIKIITQLKNSIEKSNNKHIFVVKFKHVDITYFNNQKKNLQIVHSQKRPQFH